MTPTQIYDQIQVLLAGIDGAVGCRRLGPRRFEVQWANGEVSVWALAEGPRRTTPVRVPSQKHDRWMGTLKTDGPLITCVYCGRRLKARVSGAVAIKSPMPMHRAEPAGAYCFGSPPQVQAAKRLEWVVNMETERGDLVRAAEYRRRAAWARRDSSVAPPKKAP